MMGRQTGDQSQLFYLFNLEELIPASHLLRRINPVVSRVLAELRENLTPFYSDIGRPSIDPELMLRMLIVGYCYGIRFERRLCEEVELHLAYRWFCRLDLDDQVPDHSTFSVNRHGRFRNSAIFRKLFEAVVRACMSAGLVKGEGFAVDASVMEADASRYHGQAPGETDWSAPERQTRAVAEFLSSLDDEGSDADRKLPKVISPTDPCSAWTAKANKRVQFGYGLNYMIDLEHAVIVDVEATPARTYDEVAATRTMIDRTEMAFGLKPARITADTAYGTGKLLAWLLDRDITPHIPVWDRYQRTDGRPSHLAVRHAAARNQRHQRKVGDGPRQRPRSLRPRTRCRRLARCGGIAGDGRRRRRKGQTRCRRIAHGFEFASPLANARGSVRQAQREQPNPLL